MTVLSLRAGLSQSRASSHRAHKNPAWARPSLLALLALTLVLYLWDLDRNGYANDFYAAAVQAGTRSWKAFFFGSFDSSNFITVDKTPASLWVMEISGRIFGFSSWSMLVPQALEGVASAAILYAAVRRWFGPGAGLLAGLVLALTPAAALIFRFNNPDALLVLLMTAAGYAVTRSLERERGATRWLVLAGVLVGLAFLAKMMQAFLVIPGFGLAYLWAGPARIWRRLWQLLAAIGGVVAGAGWWVLIAQLTPAADRPYFGGSTNNNIVQLALGYNGLGRLDGTETGSIGGGSRFGGPAGIFRLFGSEFGGQISWLLPAALLALVALLWVSRRAARTDRVRAFALLWGGWLLVTGVTFSYMQGIIHPYYMVALAPAIAALVGVGGMALWQAGLGWLGRGAVAIGVAATAGWSFELLNRTPAWLPWLRWVVLIAGALAVLAILAAGLAPVRRLGGTGRFGGSTGRFGGGSATLRALSLVPLGLSLVAGLAGPLAYSVETAGTTHTGAIPSAGPQVAGAFGGMGGGGFPGGTRSGTHTGRGGAGGFPGGFGGTGTGGSASSGTAPSFPGRAGGAGRAGFAGGAGGAGGLSGGTQVDSTLIKLLETDASKYKWIAATEGSQEAAPIELATGGDAVMAIGGFNGTDPAPTLAEFESLVAKHEIHYYVGRGSGSFGGGAGSSAIASWVAAHFTSETVGGTTVYNLTQPK
jgi:4-amino-4-deoxy-L-arabinose transferase-like glycosyltransferase